jgi:uncharacterized protein YdhG (YjbR/CyaY superfamily)
MANKRAPAPSAPRSPEIDAYIAALSEPVRGRFEVLREVVRAEAPEATERFSYGLPTWSQGENLVHLGAHERHIGLYPGPAAIVAFMDELGSWKTSKGAIQLPHDRELPVELVGRITRWRVTEAAANVAAKAAAKHAAKGPAKVETTSAKPTKPGPKRP